MSDANRTAALAANMTLEERELFLQIVGSTPEELTL